MQKPFTIVLEFNCYRPESEVSVWLIPDQQSYAADRTGELVKIPGAILVFGPVPEEKGCAAFEKLCGFLKSAGVDFESQVTADD